MHRKREIVILYICNKFIDNNKDRKPKRDIIAKEKRKLEEAIAAYNVLVPDREAVDTADAVLIQDFPIWPWDSGKCTLILHFISIVCIFISLLFRYCVCFWSDTISHILCI